MVKKFTEAQKKKKNTEDEPRTLKLRTRHRPAISDIMKKFENLLKVQNTNEFRCKITKQNSKTVLGSHYTHTAERAVDQEKDLTSPRVHPRTDEKCSRYEENQTFTSEILSEGGVKRLCSCVVVEWSENVIQNACVMTEEPREMNKVTDVWTSFTDSLIHTEAFQQHMNTNKTKHTEENNVQSTETSASVVIIRQTFT